MHDSESYIFASYFDYNIYLLKLTTFWYHDKTVTPRKRNLQLIYNLAWSFYVYIFYLPSEILYALYSYNNLDKFLRSVRDLGNHIALIYKAINYVAHRKQILKLLDILRYGDYNYESYDDFDPKAILENEKQDAIKWTKSFWRFVNAICLTMFVSGGLIFIFAGDKQFVEENGKMVYAQKQPVNTVSPFGQGTRIQHLFTFFYTIIALTYYAAMIVALDSLCITLMSAVSSHLLILQGAFRTMRPRCMLRLKMQLNEQQTLVNTKELNDEMELELVKCIRHLQIVFNVSAKLEHIYHGQTFCQTLISLGEMCFSLYLLSQVIDENAGNEFTYLIATGFELFMYCWFGNRITEASLRLRGALFQCDWLATSQKFRKQLIFTMTRMQRPISITIGKITPLTFTTFLTIVRGAYSFFTFLKQKKLN